jgi:sulfur transfer protein SufE
MSVAVPLHEIRAEFQELDDPTDRLTYLVEIGRTLPPLAEHLRTEENHVQGCQAKVWLVAEPRPDRRKCSNSRRIATPRS